MAPSDDRPSKSLLQLPFNQTLPSLQQNPSFKDYFRLPNRSIRLYFSSSPFRRNVPHRSIENGIELLDISEPHAAATPSPPAASSVSENGHASPVAQTALPSNPPRSRSHSRSPVPQAAQPLPFSPSPLPPPPGDSVADAPLLPIFAQQSGLQLRAVMSAPLLICNFRQPSCPRRV